GARSGHDRVAAQRTATGDLRATRRRRHGEAESEPEPEPIQSECEGGSMTMRKRVLLAATIVGAMAGTAFAAKVGDVLFSKARNTKVLATASPTADVVVVLQPGD